MGWIILIVIVAVIATCLDSSFGKLTIGAGVVAIGSLMLRWITGISFFVTLAKICAVGIVLIVLWVVLAGIFGK